MYIDVNSKIVGLSPEKDQLFRDKFPYLLVVGDSFKKLSDIGSATNCCLKLVTAFYIPIYILNKFLPRGGVHI
jgi:hypothetical protein